LKIESNQSKKSLTMTKTEGNSSNRRQPEDKLNSQGDTKHPQEDTREGSNAKAGGTKKISSSGTGVRTMTDKDPASRMPMEMTATPQATQDSQKSGGRLLE
jgi:hypothetical protein